MSSANDDAIWKVLWKLSVPPKVHVFWCRVVNDFLPFAEQISIIDTF
jgi:hypothetical protein